MTTIMSFAPPEAITTFPTRTNTKDIAPFEGKFACYSLVPLPDPAALLDAVNKDDAMYNDGWPDAYMMLPPKYDFTGEYLSDIVDYHVQLTAKQSQEQEYEDSIASTIFVVAIHEDYNKHGVLVVDLQYQSYSDNVYVAAVARCALDAKGQQSDKDVISALAWCVNIEVGNMDCEEMVEDVKNIPWESPIPGYAKLQEQLTQSANSLKDEARACFSKLPVRHSRYIVHDIGSGHYASIRRIMAIDPNKYYLENLEMCDRGAVTYGINSTTTNDTVESMWLKIRKEHPKRCAQSGGLWQVEKFWMFVYDMPASEDRGLQVALVKVVWDGITEGKSKQEMEGIVPEVEVVERCEPSRALKRMDEVSSLSSRSAER